MPRGTLCGAILHYFVEEGVFVEVESGLFVVVLDLAAGVSFFVEGVPVVVFSVVFVDFFVVFFWGTLSVAAVDAFDVAVVAAV